MIDEIFIQSSLKIRREYLKISNNMDMYQKRAKEVVNLLEKTIGELEDLQKKVKGKDLTSDESVKNLLEILQNVEDEGQQLESLVDPMNKEIEKLAKEEQELYRQIRLKHSELTEDQIIEDVKKRLNEEGLI